MSVIEVYTDGACVPNPGQGGWAFYVRFPDGSEEKQGGTVRFSTNNEMELTAILYALEFLFHELQGPAGRISHAVRIYSDSQLSVNLCNALWQCKKDHLKPIVKDIRVLMGSFERLTILWVRGHNGNTGNVIADQLANQYAVGFSKEGTSVTLHA